MKLRHFLVSTPGTIEDSSWVIYAKTAAEAAELYVRAVLDEVISVDPEEMEDYGEVKIEAFPPAPEAPGIVDWGDVVRSMIPLSSIEAWVSRDDANEEPGQGF